MTSITQFELRTNKDLETYGVRLGKIDQIPYSDCLKKLNNVARAAGITNPLLYVNLEFPANSYKKEQPFPIVSEIDWKNHIKEVKEHKLKTMPYAFMIDGSRLKRRNSLF